MDEFDPNVQKTPIIPAPFRREMFEPIELPLNKPIVASYLIPKPETEYTEPIEPVIGSDGQEYFRISDVKRELEHEVKKLEEEVHEEFMKKLTDYLAECWERNVSEGEPDIRRTQEPPEGTSYIW